MADLNKLHDAILSGDANTAATVTREAIEENLDPSGLIAETMVPAMAEAGRLYESGEYFVPELLLSARAMKGAVALLRPLLTATGTEPVGRVVIGTVQGDLHDIGKNLVASMLEGGGFDVIDLGVDVSAEKFVAAIQKNKPQLLCLSGLLTVTIPGMKRIIEAVQQAGLRDQVKVLVGGAPVTPEYATELGADGYGANASAAVTVAKQFCPGRSAGQV